MWCIRKNILGGVYPYDQLAGVGGQVKKDAKKQEAPTRFALVEVEVIHMETGEKMCVLGKNSTRTEFQCIFTHILVKFQVELFSKNEYHQPPPCVN